MKRNLCKLLGIALCAALVVDASGGTLAQPERTDQRDRWIGFQLVYEKVPPAIDMSDPNWEDHLDEIEPEDRTGWVEYGSEQVNLDGFGTVNFARQVLFGEYDGENNRYVFPGKEGFNCFLTVVPEEDWPYQDYTTMMHGQIISGHNDLWDRELVISMEGGATRISGGPTSAGSIQDPGPEVDEFFALHGKVYLGPPLDDTNWNTENYDYAFTAYRVYQTPDGRVYLTDGGSSYGGAGGMGATSTETSTISVNGEPATRVVEIGFKIEGVERLTQAAVTWFDGDNAPLAARTLTPEEIGEGLELPRPAGAVWALVEEQRRGGAVNRTVYTLEEEHPVTHSLVLLDDLGLGRDAARTLR